MLECKHEIAPYFPVLSVIAFVPLIYTKSNNPLEENGKKKQQQYKTTTSQKQQIRTSKLFIMYFVFVFVFLFMLIDIDECVRGLNDCHSSASCTNTVGSFSCSCNHPFKGDGKTCRHSATGKSVTSIMRCCTILHMPKLNSIFFKFDFRYQNALNRENSKTF